MEIIRGGIFQGSFGVTPHQLSNGIPEANKAFGVFPASKYPPRRLTQRSGESHEGRTQSAYKLRTDTTTVRNIAKGNDVRPDTKNRRYGWCEERQKGALKVRPQHPKKKQDIYQRVSLQIHTLLSAKCKKCFRNFY